MKTVTTVSSESIASFRDSLLAKGRSEQTAKAYSSDLTVMLSDLKLLSLPAEDFELTASLWLNRNRRIIAPKTTRRRLSACRTFARWAGWGNLLSDFSAPSPLRGEPHPLPEGVEGVKKMIACARQPHNKALVSLLGLCGLRVSEALEIRPSSIDTRDMTLTVRGKGDKIRKVPISSVAWEAMKDAVFAAFLSGKDDFVVGVRDRAARSMVTELGARAGIKRRVASHDLRATFATAVYNKTGDQRLVQELLGHASGDTTQIYVAVAGNKLKEAVEL